MTPEQIETYVDAASAALGLQLQAAHRPGVLQFFALAAAFAATLEAVPLAPHDESALSFVAVSPQEEGA